MNKPKLTKIIVRLIWIGTLLGILTLTLIFTLINRGIIGYIPSFEDLENPKTNLATEVYSADGELLGKFYNENRTIVEFKGLSPNIVNSLLATEDIRFYKHTGIDMRALGRVMVKTILLGKSAGGGSTITQQLAKNLYRMREKKIVKKQSFLARKFSLVIMKFQEWVTAVKLERNYTKDEIMVMYLNTVTFGHNAYGIKSASNIFFGKSPDSLKIEEAAVLIGLLRAPTYYSPILNPDRSKIRRNTVISQIEKYQKKLHKINGFKIHPKSYYDSLRNLPLVIHYHKQTHNQGLATYFREYLRLYVTATKPKLEDYPSWNKNQYYEDSALWQTDPLYGWCNKNLKPDGTPYNIYRDGLKIYTTIDSRMQQYAENAVAWHLGTGPEPLQKAFEKQLKYSKNPPFSNKLTSKQVKEIINRTMRRTDRWITMKRNGIPEKKIIESFHQPVRMTVFSWNGDIDTVMTPYDSILYYKKFLRAGLVSIEPQTGFIRAYVGGLNYNYFKYDHVMVARRQVGSTFKPFVYTLAMMPGGYSPCYQVQNIPYTIDVWDNGRKKAYTPTFSKSKFDDQLITLKTGLALSLNQISAWVIKQYGPEAVIKIARSMGVKSPLPPVYSLCVGAAEVKLIEMASAYCTFANKGVHVSPIFVTKIVDKYGNVLATFTPKKNQAIDENTAYKMIVLMRGVVQYGTSVRLRLKYKITSDIAGKTGTTNDNSDGWFIGIAPKLVTGVWVGGEERSIRFYSTALGQGANMALPIFAKYMQQIYNNKNLPYKPTDVFEKPSGLDESEINCDDFNNNNSNINNTTIDF